MMTHRIDHGRNIRRIAVGAAAIAFGVLALPQFAVAETIWGQQGGGRRFETTKVDLPAPRTITSISYESTHNYCIWSGVPWTALVICGQDQDLVGTVLPAGKGYYAIPQLKDNSNALVRVEVNVK